MQALRFRRTDGGGFIVSVPLVIPPDEDDDYMDFDVKSHNTIGNLITMILKEEPVLKIMIKNIDGTIIPKNSICCKLRKVIFEIDGIAFLLKMDDSQGTNDEDVVIISEKNPHENSESAIIKNKHISNNEGGAEMWNTEWNEERAMMVCRPDDLDEQQNEIHWIDAKKTKLNSEQVSTTNPTPSYIPFKTQPDHERYWKKISTSCNRCDVSMGNHLAIEEKSDVSIWRKQRENTAREKLKKQNIRFQNKSIRMWENNSYERKTKKNIIYSGDVLGYYDTSTDSFSEQHKQHKKHHKKNKRKKSKKKKQKTKKK